MLFTAASSSSSSSTTPAYAGGGSVFESALQSRYKFLNVFAVLSFFVSGLLFQTTITSFVDNLVPHTSLWETLYYFLSFMVTLTLALIAYHIIQRLDQANRVVAKTEKHHQQQQLISVVTSLPNTRGEDDEGRPQEEMRNRKHPAQNRHKRPSFYY
jgi:hypothetical protein